MRSVWLLNLFFDMPCQFKDLHLSGALPVPVGKVLALRKSTDALNFNISSIYYSLTKRHLKIAEKNVRTSGDSAPNPLHLVAHIFNPRVLV